MCAGIFIGDYTKNMILKMDHSGTSMSQMELVRSSVIPRLKFGDQILLLLMEVKIVDVPYLEMCG